MAQSSEPSFERFVALGDSTTEGLVDPGPDGELRGWADRLAERIARRAPDLRYANLAIRGRKLPQIHAEQLEPALEMEPDLVSLLGGVNDILRPRVDLRHNESLLEQMATAFRERGATVLLFTYPDLSKTIRLAGGPIRGRITGFNRAVRSIARRTGSVLADLEATQIDHPAMWSEDKLHASPHGHRRIAAVAADALGIEPLDPAWADGLPEPRAAPLGPRLAGAARWTATDLGPWIGRRLRGVSSGDGRDPKRPALEPVSPTETA